MLLKWWIHDLILKQFHTALKDIVIVLAWKLDASKHLPLHRTDGGK